MITIDQQPYLLSKSKQDLIILATSDNVGEIGFKYLVNLTISDNNIITSGTFQFYISPNSNDSCVINIKDLLSAVKNNESQFDLHSVHDAFTFEDIGYAQIDSLTIGEAWIIDSVLTENPDSSVGVNTPIYVINGYYEPEFGFNPNPQSTDSDISMVLNGSNKRAYSDRKSTTHVWSWAASFGISSNAICIPVFEEDYGTLKYSAYSSMLDLSTVAKIKIQLFDSSGAPHSYTEAVQGTVFENLRCYPANLNANTTTVGLPQPADYPNWRFYTIQFLTDADAPCGVTYVFYNAYLYGQQDCKHDRIRLGWVNSRGGWDYFNFIKKNEESFSMDRKRYHKIRGNYSTASDTTPFNYLGSDAGLTERGSLVQRFLNITSDWIQEGEFEFLQSLLVSNQVHWLQDDGTFIPVVIEANDYVSKRERNGKLKNLDLKLRLANNLY